MLKYSKITVWFEKDVLDIFFKFKKLHIVIHMQVRIFSSRPKLCDTVDRNNKGSSNQLRFIQIYTNCSKGPVSGVQIPTRASQIVLPFFLISKFSKQIRKWQWFLNYNIQFCIENLEMRIKRRKWLSCPDMDLNPGSQNNLLLIFCANFLIWQRSIISRSS